MEFNINLQNYSNNNKTSINNNKTSIVFLAMIVNFLIDLLPNLTYEVLKESILMVCKPLYIKLELYLNKVYSNILCVIYISFIYTISNDLITFILGLTIPIFFYIAYGIIKIIYYLVTNLIKYLFTNRIWCYEVILPFTYYILFLIWILFLIISIELKIDIRICNNLDPNIIKWTYNLIQHIDLNKLLEDFTILLSSEPSSPIDSLNGSGGGSPGYPGGSPSPGGYENAMVLGSTDEDRNRFTNSPVQQPGGFLGNINNTSINNTGILSIIPNGYSTSDEYSSSNVSPTSNVNVDNRLSMNMEVRRYLNVTYSLLNVITSNYNGFILPQIPEPSYITHNMVGYFTRPDGGYMSVFNHMGLFTQPVYFVNHNNGVSEYVQLGLHYRFIPVNTINTYICEVTFPNGYVINYVNFETFLISLLDHKALMINDISNIFLSEDISSVVDNVNRFIENSLIINYSPAPYIIRHYSHCL